MSGIFDRHISGGAGKVIQYVFWVSFPEPDFPGCPQSRVQLLAQIAHLRTKLSPNMETGLLYQIMLLVSYICKCRQACLLVPQLNPNVVEPKLVWRKRDRESAKVAIIDCAQILLTICLHPLPLSVCSRLFYLILDSFTCHYLCCYI